jgi:hypothetical protein
MSYKGRALGSVLVLAGVFATSCGLFRGQVNSSPGLRWWLFSTYGAEKICPEMLSRAVGLRLTPGATVQGRFFPSACSAQVNDSTQTVAVQFQGSGWVWSPMAGRVGFTAGATVEYRMDFRLTEDATYVWGQPQRVLTPPVFQLGTIENKLVDWAAHNLASDLTASVGQQLLSSQLTGGFTAIRTDSGDEFALGHLEPPQRPAKPFATGDESITLANETTEVRLGQLDLLGPLQVREDDQALTIRTQVSGAAVDVLLLPRGTGDLWYRGLQLGAPLGPPPGQPVRAWVAPTGSGPQIKVPVARGEYYLAIDNSDRVGTVAPAFTLLGAVGDGVATVSVGIQLTEADD